MAWQRFLKRKNHDKTSMHHFYIDEYCKVKSLLSRIDPGIKTVIFLTLIIFIALTQPAAYPSFAFYGGIILILVALSKIPLHFIFMRSLTIIPFVLAAAIFMPFLKSEAGIILFWGILIKAYLSIVCVILLVGSTKFSRLLKAFEKMRLPKIFIMMMSFMYRYIFVIFDELMAMKQAKEARSVGGSRWFQIKILANILGSLFIRTYEKGESVYLAMCSRGFNGEVKTMNQLNISLFDIAFLLAVVASVAAIRIFVG